MKSNNISNSYSLVGLVKLLIRVLITKVRYPGQRIIRSGFEVRGRKMIKFGKGLTTGKGCRIEAFVADGNKKSKIFIGDRIQLNDYVHISAVESVSVGDDTLVASHVYISDNSHGSYAGDNNDSLPEEPPVKRAYFSAPVSIGKCVWIGEGVIIMPGSNIGDGAILGAHSVVKGVIPGNSIAVGSPARVVKKWNENKGHWEKVK